MTESPERTLLYYLPGSTSSLVNRQARQTKNMRLLMDKFVPANVINQGEYGDKSERGKWLQALVRNNQPDPALAQAAYQRWLNMTNACQAEVIQGTIEWRMVVGLGGNNILETDITLHHLYGMPIIPGSAIKGMTRAFAASRSEYKVTYETKNKDGEEETKKDVASPDDTRDHPKLKEIFGHAGEGNTSGSAGTVIFFDALPVNGAARLEVDIMNPHYPDYYKTLNDNSPKRPTNDQNPIPIMFLTVPEASFAFAVAPRNPLSKQHQDDAKEVLEWLKTALQVQGAGGKTSAGYGYFKDLKEIEKPKRVERIRSNVKAPTAGQNVQCVALENIPEMRRRLHEPESSAFFKYMEYSSRDAIIVVREEENAGRSWTPGNTANLRVLGSEQVGDCLVIYCQASPKKNMDKDKKKKR